MRIGALGLGTPFSKQKGDCGWCLSWHHPLDITWRWSLDIDYFWRKYGYNGKRPAHVRKWKWSYLRPGCFQNVFYRWENKWHFSPTGGFGWHWLGISMSYHYQPKWDRTFDAEAARRQDRENDLKRELRIAVKEREHANLQ